MRDYPSDDGVRQVVVHPAWWDRLVVWLETQGLELIPGPHHPYDLPTYYATPIRVFRPGELRVLGEDDL